MDEQLDQSPAARARRQAIWQRGYDRARALDRDRHFASGDPTLTAYEEYLFLVGISNYLTAKGRDLAGIDARPAAPASALGE